MEDTNYRYTELTGSATVTRSGMVIRVTLHDAEVNPNRMHLRFDKPLSSDPAANPEQDGTIERDNVHIVAGLNRDWYKYHTEVDGFRFKKENGEFAQSWEDLDLPKAGEEMDPVKPEKSDLQTNKLTADAIVPEV